MACTGMPLVQIEAMKLALADAYRYVSDPRMMEVSPAKVRDVRYLPTRAKMVNMKRAQDSRPAMRLKAKPCT
jgi:gamma-glutamyltranspeptidase/glutathione hydrolase